jgi:hypothetical protein
MPKADETYSESVVALHDWLEFLDEKEIEIKSQQERLRRKDGESGASSAEEAPLSVAPETDATDTPLPVATGTKDDAETESGEDPWM